MLNERIRGAWKSTPLTRSVLVLRELGPAGAASHHERPSDGAQCLAVCTCVQQQPAPLMLTVHTPDVRARARVRMREPGVRRTAFDKNGYNERAAYLPYDPPTPHPRLDCPERLYQPNPYRQSKRRRTGLAANFDRDVVFHSKTNNTKQNKNTCTA